VPFADPALASRFVAGDDTALNELYRDVSSLVFTLALRALGSADDAEDVTQQTFINAWRARESFDPARGELRGWIVGIAKRRITDELGQRQRQLRVVNSIHDSLDGREAIDPAAEMERVLLAYEVESLGDPQATVIAMAFFEGTTHQQISERLGMPLGTVKSHVRRGLVALRNRLEVSGVAS
jgi:RNA polymerase sigma-70 factor (ECF subfamily)